MKEELKTRFANERDTNLGNRYNTPIDGLFQVHWPNGNLRYEWYYKDGKRADGISRGWWENGNLKQEKNWKNGKQNGFWTSWYENGLIWLKRDMKDGKLVYNEHSFMIHGEKLSDDPSERYLQCRRNGMIGKMDGGWDIKEWDENGNRIQ
jgi:antitoxin component YwqK of YwqJK toxin-antitoxin module